jgi:hypothetical protein
LHTYAQVIISTFFTSNIYMGLCIPKALTFTRLWSYKLREVLLTVRINNSICLRGILTFHLLRAAFPSRLARGIQFIDCVPYPYNPPSELNPLIFAEQCLG